MWGLPQQKPWWKIWGLFDFLWYLQCHKRYSEWIAVALHQPLIHTCAWYPTHPSAFRIYMQFSYALHWLVPILTCMYLNVVEQLEMLLIPNALCWSSRKCNCACTLPAEVQLRLRVTCRSWQKLFAGKNFVKILVTALTQLHSYSEQQRAFGNSNICTGGRKRLPKFKFSSNNWRCC